jgi:flavin reductase (DIM6/NTAB) family NADH-FMN oxidoreductase RutF
MNKVTANPGTSLFPLPAVMVSMGDSPEEYNIITISWTGTVNSSPPMCYISVRPGRHSYSIIKNNMEFVINLTTRNLLYAADWCGMKSGKDFNKFREMKLTPGKCQIVKAPLIEESPVNIECRVNRILPLGSHHMFIADVVAINLDEKFKENLAGNVMNSYSDLISYSFGYYYDQGKESGKYGFSAFDLK